MNTPDSKRLIEVDLPIKRISTHARREKSIRRGHISTLHLWWARRPLAACRAVMCAALWPDPADPLCPSAFRENARSLMREWASDSRPKQLGEESYRRLVALQRVPDLLNDNEELRASLLDFVADFANWDNSVNEFYIETARALTRAAHEAMGGAPGTQPLVVDPFAGGGAIPIEALRAGANVFASDLNPVAVLLNKVELEYIPKYGHELAAKVQERGHLIQEQAKDELAKFYPKDPDGALPIAYLWARTITCEGPRCGAEVPLITSLWLARKPKRSVALRLVPNPAEKRVDFQIIQHATARDVGEATVRKGTATCPCCGFTTPVTSVRRQLKSRRGGTFDARLFCVVVARPGHQGRSYRLPEPRDMEATDRARNELHERQRQHVGDLSLVPDEHLDVRGIRHTWAMIYGMDQWSDYFTPRQALALTTLVRLVRGLPASPPSEQDGGLATAVRTCLALAVDRQVDAASSLCRWHVTREVHTGTFGRQALPMVWDFSEVNVLSEATGGFHGAVEWVTQVCEANAALAEAQGRAEPASATRSPLPDGVAQLVFTDPPYYDAVPYAYLSDYFYVWLRRTLRETHPDLFRWPQVPKAEEIVVDRPHEMSNSTKDIASYESGLTRAFEDARRVLHPSGIATIVFASKTTASWEAFLQAVLDAGWVTRASWPIDTEMEARVAAQGQARLASSVHLVCRPRPLDETTTHQEEVGDWRDVLAQLPERIHAWMPRLAREGIVGADAIFACLGPAMEVFSQYSQVEKASGERVTLREYLEYVWATVGREALGMMFEGADVSGLEEDARLTAMWLWTLNTGSPGAQSNGAAGELQSADEVGDEVGDEVADGRDHPRAVRVSGGYSLEFDAARKIAQGLGAHLEQLGTLVEVRGNIATLLAVADRARFLSGANAAEAQRARRKPIAQLGLFDMPSETGDMGSNWIPQSAPPPGRTTLDRLHQSMLLFAAGRTEALRRFLVENGIGGDERFWRLAQALSALYPMGSDEKRWVDGVLARKKGWGM